MGAVKGLSVSQEEDQTDFVICTGLEMLFKKSSIYNKGHEGPVLKSWLGQGILCTVKLVALCA